MGCRGPRVQRPRHRDQHHDDIFHSGSVHGEGELESCFYCCEWFRSVILSF
jgi:hypothetical protein